MENTRLSISVEMQTRLRLTEVLISETNNLDMAEDLLSKGVLLFFYFGHSRQILRIPKVSSM